MIKTQQNTSTSFGVESRGVFKIELNQIEHKIKNQPKKLQTTK